MFLLHCPLQKSTYYVIRPGTSEVGSYRVGDYPRLLSWASMMESDVVCDEYRKVKHRPSSEKVTEVSDD